MKPSPSWVVPIVGACVDARISLTQGNGVQLSMPTHATGMTSLEACQLSLALQEASRIAGQAKARSR